jgi:hypothetical protein
MSLARFMVMRTRNVWRVSYQDRNLGSFPTRAEAEGAAFEAAHAAAQSGEAVSVLIVPEAAHDSLEYGTERAVGRPEAH